MVRTLSALILLLAVVSLLNIRAEGQSLFNNAEKAGLVQEGLRTGARQGGGSYSEVQFGNASTGVSFRRTTFWVADDFLVPRERWRVRAIYVWGFQPSLHYPSVDQGFIEIRKGRHDGPTVGVGQWERSEMTDIYRIFNARPEDTYQLQRVKFCFDQILVPGEYWLVLAGLGVVNVPGPYSPYLTKVGQITVPDANAMARISDTTLYWQPIRDPGSFAPQDIPFWIDGEKLPITAQPGERVDPPMVVPDPVAYLQRGVW